MNSASITPLVKTRSISIQILLSRLTGDRKARTPPCRIWVLGCPGFSITRKLVNECASLQGLAMTNIRIDAPIPTSLAEQ